MNEVPIKDVIALMVPEGVVEMAPPGSPLHDLVIAKLNQLAQHNVMAQFVERAPRAILITSLDWLITDDPDEADEFQPAHDCAACIAGSDQARAWLRENPGRYLALGNIEYTEVW